MIDLFETLAVGGITNRRQHCPICDPSKQHSRSLKLSDSGFICFRCGQTGNSQAALKLFDLAIPTTRDPSYYQLDRTRETAWVIYARNKTAAQDYLLDRGYPQTVLDLEFGYASNSTTLATAGMSSSAIESIGLNTATPQRELFADRIVFPIRNARGAITHFQARATNAESKCKWLACSDRTYGSLNQKLYNADRIGTWSKSMGPTLILCEGISDALALTSMGLPAVATFGIQQLQLMQHRELFNCNIIAAYDNDRHPIGMNTVAGKSKSWVAMLPQLAALQRQMAPGYNIFTLDIPNLSGVKDIFDLCQYLDWDAAAFLEYGAASSTSLATKIIETFGLSNLGDTIKHLAGLTLTSTQATTIEQAVLIDGGWLNVIKAAFH